jgi:hypothetical protein
MNRGEQGVLKKKSLKRTLIISGCYVLLLAALLIGLTLARYQDAMQAYTDFKAAEFNALILGENTVEDMRAGRVNKFGVNLVTTGFRPGMTWRFDASGYNQDSVIRFSVSNGSNDEDFSEVPIEYTLKLRTSGNLPLKFTLAAWESGEPDGEPVYYNADNIKPVQNDSKERDPGNWYEYSFYPSGSPEEAVFELPGGKLSLNSYKILIEWPVSKDSDSLPVYMKEVELVEILANISSKNMLEEEGYGESPIPTDVPVYSTGVILLKPIGGQAVGTYTYEIDYRSFEPVKGNDSVRSYSFTIENGIDKHVAQTANLINYTALLKITLETADDYIYTLNGSEIQPAHYRLYDERRGTFELLDTAEYPEGKKAPDYRIYAMYTLAAAQLDNSSNDADTYTLTIEKTDSGVISTAELESISFNNKLELIVEAVFAD